MGRRALRGLRAARVRSRSPASLPTCPSAPKTCERANVCIRIAMTHAMSLMSFLAKANAISRVYAINADKKGSILWTMKLAMHVNRSDCCNSCFQRTMLILDVGRMTQRPASKAVLSQTHIMHVNRKDAPPIF